MNPYKMFETSSEAEQEGLELNYGSFSIWVARSGGANQKYNKIMEALTKPHLFSIKNETITPEMVKSIRVEAHAKAVVLRWKGVTDREGNEMEFSVENCIKLFTDLDDLFEDVSEQAGKAGLFRKDIIDLTVGN